MIKQCIRSIAIMLKYARGTTIVKLIQLIAAAVLTPLSIYFTQRLIDSAAPFVKGNLEVKEVTLWAGLLIFSMFFTATEGYFDGLVFIRMNRNLNKHLTPAIIDKFKHLDYACFEDREVQDTINRMSDAPQEKLLNIFLNTTSMITILVGVLGTMVIFAQVSMMFAIGFIALLLPMAWFNFKGMEMMNTMFNNQSIEQRKLNYLSGLLSNKAALFELKIFNAVEYIILKWRKRSKIVLDERVKTTIRSQKYFLLSTILFKMWCFFVVLYLIYAIADGRITVGIFTALIASTYTILNHAEMLSHSFTNLSQRYLEIKHFYSFMALPEVKENDNDNDDVITDAYIFFDNVTFTYPKTKKEVLKGISFEIKPGENVALVGKNGAGKSTIIKLLCRLYKPDSGRILVNGRDINELSQKQLSEVFSVVFQDFANYSLTLRENIAFGDIKELKDDSSILEALNEGLAEEILKLSDKGLEMNLGKLEEDGVDLSGGQWQRIALARACISNSSFVILDEPTASLDPVAESDMYAVFSSVLKNKGSIIISHRLASAKLSDKIIVLHHGVVEEYGSHMELMNKGGLYSKMFNAQSSWYIGGAAYE